MHARLSRRTITSAVPASLLGFASSTTSFAQTPDFSSEEDRYPDLLDRLAATDPETVLDLLLETPFEADWLVPGAVDPPIQPQAVELIVDETSQGKVIGAVSLPHPNRDATMGGFIVFADDTLAAEEINGTLADLPANAVQRLTLAGLDGVMILSVEQAANVYMHAKYVVVISSDNILAGRVVQDRFAAQIRALQHALGLIWHLYGALRQ